jgi:hypothetical protein
MAVLSLFRRSSYGYGDELAPLGKNKEDTSEKQALPLSIYAAIVQA